MSLEKKSNLIPKKTGRKSNRDRTLVKLLESSALMASEISTICLSSDPNELCQKLKIITARKRRWYFF